MSAGVAVRAAVGFDVEKIRADFPILHRKVRGHDLVYLDNAATSQKPQAVIDALVEYYEAGNANIHRGVHYLSEKATEDFEQARRAVRGFVNAADASEIVFVRGTTEAINLVAQSYGRANVGAGDEIVITAMEHHSNIVPWQMLCDQKGAKLRVAPIDDRGELLIEEYEKLLTDRTRLAAVAHVSNALGTVNPVKRMIAMAHAKGIPVLLDGAQAVPHIAVDVRGLDCEFYAFSAHKMYGPTGVGALYAKKQLLEAMPPWQGGGDMISSVTFEKTTWNKVPHKFEAGTPDMAGVIAWRAAIEYMNGVGIAAIAAHEHDLLDYATKVVGALPGIRIIGTAQDKAGVLSFVIEDVHPHDIGTILDQQGIAVRTGHHCAQPVMDRFCIPATVRASFAMYNTRAEVDALARGIEKVREVFA